MLFAAAVTGMMTIAPASASLPDPVLPAVATAQTDAGNPPASQATPPTQASPSQPADSTPPAADAQADIVVTGRDGPPPGDPLEKINAKSFEAVQSVDKAVVEPIAKGYNKGLPRPVRKGLRNFFTNLGEPVVAVAYLVQFKPGKAFETAGRFGVKSPPLPMLRTDTRAPELSRNHQQERLRCAA